MTITVNEVMRFFFQYFTNVIPVIGDNGLIKGVLSKGIMVKLLGERISLDSTLREQIDKALISFGSQNFGHHIGNLLSDQKASFLPVIDEDGNLVDIIHKTDLLSLSDKGMVVSREKLNQMISVLPFAVVSFSSAGVITYANEMAEKLFGFNPAGRKIRELLDVDDIPFDYEDGKLAFIGGGRVARLYGGSFRHNNFSLGGFLFLEDVSERVFMRLAMEEIPSLVKEVCALCGVLLDGKVAFGFRSFSSLLGVASAGSLSDYKALFGEYPEVCSMIEMSMRVGDKVSKKVLIRDKKIDFDIKPVKYGDSVVGLLVAAVCPQDDYWNSSLREMVRNTEKRMIEKALKETGYNISEAARLLGIPRQTLQYRLKVLGLNGNGNGEDA